MTTERTISRKVIKTRFSMVITGSREGQDRSIPQEFQTPSRLRVLGLAPCMAATATRVIKGCPPNPAFLPQKQRWSKMGAALTALLSSSGDVVPLNLLNIEQDSEANLSVGKTHLGPRWFGRTIPYCVLRLPAREVMDSLAIKSFAKAGSRGKLTDFRPWSSTP